MSKRSIISILIFLSSLVFNQDKLFAQDLEENTIKKRGFVVNAYLGFNKSRNGEIDNSSGSFSFEADDDIKGRNILDIYAIASYFIIPEHLSVGIGAGYSRSYKPDFNQIPIILDLRGFIFRETDALFLFLQYGQSPYINRDFVKGYSIGFGVGYQFRFFNEYFTIELGVKGRRISYTNEPVLSSDDNVRVGGYMINLGYTF